MNTKQTSERSNFNDIIDAFDLQWQKGSPPDLDAFLQQAGERAEDRCLLLVELIAVDLEYRWKTETSGNVDTLALSDPWLLERYLRKWPDLGSSEPVLLELIVEEYGVRSRWGHSPTHSEYHQRFPTVADQLESELSSVDRMLAREEVETPAAHASQEATIQRTDKSTLFEQEALESKHQLGDFEILEEVARGGMGVVFKARQVSLNRTVALKMILSGSLADTQEVERFRREAESVANLDHPGIVPVYQTGKLDGKHYLAMGFVEGGNLAQLVQSEGPVSNEKAARLLEEITDAVAYAHRQGFIHRDLKPTNVLLNVDGQPRITDFGLVRKVDESSLTLRGQIVGTPAYMAPEQALGKTEEVGPASDIYSLGAMLFTLLAGRPPFQAATPAETMRQVIDNKPPRIRGLNPNVDRALEDICIKCLHKNPAQRYASAEALVTALKHYRENQDRVRHASPRERGSRWTSWASVATGALALLTLIALTVAFIIRVETSEGDVIIKSYDPRVEVMVKRNGKPIQEFTFQHGPVSTKMQTGEIAIEIKGGKPDGVQIKNGKFILTKGKKVVVEIMGPVQWKGKVAEKKRNTGDSPFDAFRRENLTAYQLKLAGGGDPEQAPKELVGVLGDSRLAHAYRAVTCADFHPNGKILATTNTFDGVRFWDASTGEQLNSLSIPGAYYCVAYNPQGDKLAVGGMRPDDVLQIRSSKTGKKVRNLVKGVTTKSVNWTPDGKRIIATLESPAVIKAWDAETGREIYTINTKSPPRFTLSPDGKLIATAPDLINSPCRVELWDTQTGKHLSNMTHGKVWQQISQKQAVWSPDSSKLAQANLAWGGIWDITSRKVIHEFTNVNFVGAWSRDGKYLQAYSDDTLVVIDTKTWQIARALEPDPRSIQLPNHFVFSPNSKLLAGHNENQGNISLWNVETGKLVVRAEGHSAYAWLVDVSPDGKWIATHGWDGTIRLWDTAGGKQSAVIRSNWRDGMAFSPDSTRLAACSRDRSKENVSIWNVRTQRWERGFKIVDFSCTDLDYSSDGRLLAISGPAGVRVVSLKTGQDIFFNKIQPVPQGGWTGLLMSFVHDNSKLVLNRGKHVEILEATTGKLLRSIPIEGGSMGVRLSPDGKHLLTTVDIGHAAIYEIDSGEKVRTLKVNEADYFRFSARYNWDGSRIATLHTGRESKMLLLWDAETGRILKQIILPVGAGSAIELIFARDNRHVLVPKGDGPVYVLRLEDEKK